MSIPTVAILKVNKHFVEFQLSVTFAKSMWQVPCVCFALMGFPIVDASVFLCLLDMLIKSINSQLSPITPLDKPDSPLLSTKRQKQSLLRQDEQPLPESKQRN